MKICVLGATGQAGRHITRLLLADPTIQVTACARTAEKLDALKTALAEAPGTLHTAVVDVQDDDAIASVVSSADLVVAATSQWSDGPRLASVAVRHGVSYVGIYLSEPAKWEALRALHDECLTRGVMVVDDGGTHPGLPAVMVRWLAEEADLRTAWVGAKFGLEWDTLDLAPETVDDFVAEMESADPTFLRDGAWVRGYRHARSFDFNDGQEPASCIPMYLEEIGELGQSGLVPSTGFFIAGFGPLIDYGVMPVSMGLAKLNRRWATGLMWWGLRRLGSMPEHAALVLEAERAHDGAPLRLRVAHPDPYYLTAAPVVAAIQQMRKNPRPGVWTQAGFVDPAPFFETLETLDVTVERTAQWPEHVS